MFKPTISSQAGFHSHVDQYKGQMNPSGGVSALDGQIKYQVIANLEPTDRIRVLHRQRQWRPGMYVKQYEIRLALGV